MTHPSVGLDTRRRRILFRAWHRGTREMDLLMGRFADETLADLPEADLDDLELLMEVPDRDVFAWLTGESETPANYATPVFSKLQRFHTHDGPLPL
jgi:antitoxin CptB